MPADEPAPPAESAEAERGMGLLERPTPGHDAAELAHGLQKTRGGFMSRLRGILRGGPSDADWDAVEETLIGGDVGASLAGQVVERARRRRDADSATEAVEAELAALLLPNDPECTVNTSGPGMLALLLTIALNRTGKTTD